MAISIVSDNAGTETKEGMAAAERAELLQELAAEMAVQTGQAVDRAFSYADKLAKRYLAELQATVAQIGKPKIMVVQVNGERRKLSKPAAPCLGRMIINAKLGINTMLVGPAGSGKSTAAQQLAESLGLEFGHICLTAGASETWLFGRQTPHGFIEAPFSRLYREGGVFLCDEFDAADPNLLMAINTAIENGHLFNPISGETHKRHENFILVAAANTVGKGADHTYTARSRLDGATLRRFDKIKVDYSPEIEEQVCPHEELRNLLQSARAKIRELKATEIISTGCLLRAYTQLQAGVELGDILESLTMGWPEELVKQCGLNVTKFPKAKKEEKEEKESESQDGKAEDLPF